MIIYDYSNVIACSNISSRYYQIIQPKKIITSTSWVSDEIFKSETVGIFTVEMIDINNDGWLDIYVGNDFHENDYIYINNKNKTFKESVKNSISHSTHFTMGIDVADLNFDGHQDIFTTDMMPFDSEIFLKSGGEDSDKRSRIKKEFGFEYQFSRNHFNLNRGNGTYSEIALQTETHATDWSWGVLLQDFDCDGLM